MGFVQYGVYTSWEVVNVDVVRGYSHPSTEIGVHGYLVASAKGRYILYSLAT